MSGTAWITTGPLVDGAMLGMLGHGRELALVLSGTIRHNALLAAMYRKTRHRVALMVQLSAFHHSRIRKWHVHRHHHPIRSRPRPGREPAHTDGMQSRRVQETGCGTPSGDTPVWFAPGHPADRSGGRWDMGR